MTRNSFRGVFSLSLLPLFFLSFFLCFPTTKLRDLKSAVGSLSEKERHLQPADTSHVSIVVVVVVVVFSCWQKTAVRRVPMTAPIYTDCLLMEHAGTAAGIQPTDNFTSHLICLTYLHLVIAVSCGTSNDQLPPLDTIACNFGGTWRRICSLDIRNVSALAVLRNRALQIDIYVLTCLLTATLLTFLKPKMA